MHAAARADSPDGAVYLQRTLIDAYYFRRTVLGLAGLKVEV